MTCRHAWCTEELPIHLDDLVVVRHRRTVTHLAIGADHVLVTITALGESDPVIGIETAEHDDSDDAASTVVMTLEPAHACELMSGMVDAVTLVAPPATSDRDHATAVNDALRQSAENERATHGRYLRVGPFDDSPFGLADQITEHFTTSDATGDRGTEWLLGVLTSRHVETGTTDRTIAREIVDDLGLDATQVIGGWIFRAT